MEDIRQDPDYCINGENLWNIRTFGNCHGCGGHKIFKRLVELGIICKNGDHYSPTIEYRTWFRPIKRVYFGPDLPPQGKILTFIVLTELGYRNLAVKFPWNDRRGIIKKEAAERAAKREAVAREAAERGAKVGTWLQSLNMA